MQNWKNINKSKTNEYTKTSTEVHINKLITVCVGNTGKTRTILCSLKSRYICNKMTNVFLLLSFNTMSLVILHGIKKLTIIWETYVHPHAFSSHLLSAQLPHPYQLSLVFWLLLHPQAHPLQTGGVEVAILNPHQPRISSPEQGGIYICGWVETEWRQTVCGLL